MERTMASPVFPREALQVARQWEQGPRRIVGAGVLARERPEDCGSCGGEGKVYLRLLRDGPTRAPIGNMKVSTYVEDEHRPGWWVIDKTEVYLCPKCRGTGEHHE